MTSLYAASKPEILSRNATSEAHATSARAPRIDVIDGAARVVAALTLTGTAALLAPPLAAALGPATLSAPFYLAIVLIAGTLGYACAFAAIGASALALIVESPSLASGALSIGDALGILMFATTSIIIAAVLSRLPRERARARSLAQFARTCAGERDDAREAREALRARLLVQRDWYEAAMQTVDDVLVAVDVHGRVQFVSAAIERLTACSVANALGARLDDVVRTASDDGAAYIASARDAIAKGRALPASGPFTIRTDDGVEHAVQCMLTPVRSHAGGLLGAIVLVRDATRARRGSRERTRLVQLARQAASTAVAAQRSLELAERKFAAFMSELPFPAYILGENGDMIFENDAGRRLAGWREALACARTADDGECAFEIPGDARRYVDVRFPIHANGRVWTGGLAIDVTTRGARTESDAA